MRSLSARPTPGFARRDLPLLAWSATLTVAVLFPLLGDGYLLLRDAVSTPRTYLTDTTIGLGGIPARSVPQDWLLAVLTTVLDGGLVVKALLFAALIGAGWGFGRAALVILGRLGRAVNGPAGTAAGLAAATLAIWNPYVGERLLQGHWSLLLGYAAVGWTVVVLGGNPGAARGAGAGGSGLAGLAICLFVGGITPTGALLVLITALALSPRRWAPIIGLFALTAAPWVIATLLSRDGATADPDSIAVFAARADDGAPLWATLASLGGLWNGQAVPTSRVEYPWLGIVTTLAMCGAGMWVLFRAWRAVGRGWAIPGLAVFGLVFPWCAATGLGQAVMEALVANVPGAGLARDTSKFVALAMPLYATAIAALVLAIPRTLPVGLRRVAVAGTATGLGALCLIALPDLGNGVDQRMRAVHYPQAWYEAAAIIPDDRGDIATIPTGSFRQFDFSGRAPVLDPAARWFRAEVVQTGELMIDLYELDGVSGRASEVERAVLSGDPAMGPQLAALGVGWVLVESSPVRPPFTTPGLEPVLETPDLSLYRVPGVITESPDRPSSGAVTLVWAAHLVWLGTGLGGAGILLRRRILGSN